MYQDGKEMMQRISAYAGERTDYVQGGGGNTSVKFDDKIMAIKASGYTLGGITLEKGYVTVDFRKIQQYYNTVDPSADVDFEKESLAVNMDSITLLPGMEAKRPSVEVGFHSFLKRCVIHTHSVYANILCCSAEGREVAKEALKGSGISYIFIPYIDPGFSLTLAIKQAVDAFAEQNGQQPAAVFLENHGLIVHDDDAKGAIAAHEAVNNAIRSHIRPAAFVQPAIEKMTDGFRSATPQLAAYLNQHGMTETALKALRLYPDQLVYISPKVGDVIRIDGDTAV
jgi:rhamnose utilization protein RhaD (predicted bifunctional aldolase and dehydrogenase)